jgi:hypothetical protein
MNIREMLLDLNQLGFKQALISRHTDIPIHKIKNAIYGDRAFFSYAETEAFNLYYSKAKELANVYGDKLAEYLSEQENK